MFRRSLGETTAWCSSVLGALSASRGVDHSGHCRASPVANDELVKLARGAAVARALGESAIEPSDTAGPCSETEPIDGADVNPSAAAEVVVAVAVGVRLARLGAGAMAAAPLMARLASTLWAPPKPLFVAVRASNALNALGEAPLFDHLPYSVAFCNGLTVWPV